MAATAATTAGSSSPCASFIAESLILPTRNGSLFAAAFALVFAHTFVSVALAVVYVHPAAAAVLLQADLLTRSDARVRYALESDGFREHAEKLLLFYLAYLASKLATQVAVALAASATACGRPCSLSELVRGKAATGRIRGVLATAALVAVMELASTVLLTACFTYWWMYSATHTSTGGMESFIRVCLLLFLLLSHLCLAAVFLVAIAVSVAEEGGGAGAGSHFRLASRLLAARARRKEAAVMVLVASLLPVAIYPVYAFAVHCETALALAFVPGYLLPPAGVLLHSMVAATVFYHRCMEHHQGPAAIPSMTKLAS